MTVRAKVLVQSKQLENAQTTQYTASNCTAIIDKFTVTNTTASAVTVSIHIVPSGGSASDSNKIVVSRAIASAEPYTFPELIGHILGPGDFISTLAGAASSLTMRISGREVTT